VGGGANRLFFDIGSNYGFYSYLMSYYFPEMNCYAFEPNPKTFGFLNEMIISNNLVDKILPSNIGLGDKKEFLALHPGVEDSGHSTFLPHPEFKDSSIGTIEINTFEDWIASKNLILPTDPQWIAKIDVEGFELNVLKGMQTALRNKSFIGISVEILEHTLALNNSKPSDIEEFLNEFEYIKISNNQLIKKYKRINTANSFFIPKGSQLF